MSVTWRLLVGSTNQFALDVSLISDPEEPLSDDVIAPSWGEFSLFVEGRNLCEARDPSGISVPGVRWYLSPLFEFFIQNWEPLIHQGRLPRPTHSGTSAAAQMAAFAAPPSAVGDDSLAQWHDDWWVFFSTHCLTAARDGGIFPQVWFRRIGDDVEISWDNESNPAETPLRFLERQGAATVPVEAFTRVLFSVAHQTLQELQRRRTTSHTERLLGELGEIGSPNPTRRELRRALLFGLRRRIDESVEAIRSLGERLRTWSTEADREVFEQASLPSLVFSSASPHVRDRDVLTILDEFERSRAQRSSTQPLSSYVREIPCPFERPWKSGYELATSLRDSLGLNGEPINMENILTRLGISVRDVSLSDPSIRAVSFIDEPIAPTVLINQRSPLTQRPWARATTLAHELCHLLYDRRVGRALGVTSGPWAPSRFEQRANAFAAMFLMPEPAAVDRFLATSGALYDRVRSLAQHYGMSYQATVLHLFNLDVIEPHERDSLLDAVYDPPTES